MVGTKVILVVDTCYHHVEDVVQDESVGSAALLQKHEMVAPERMCWWATTEGEINLTSSKIYPYMHVLRNPRGLDDEMVPVQNEHGV